MLPPDTPYLVASGRLFAFDGGLTTTVDGPEFRSSSATRFGVWAAVGAAGFVLGRAWVWGRRWLVWLVAVNVVSAAVPAGQVLAVSWLVSSAQSGRSVVVPLVALAVLIAVGQLSNELDGMTQQRAAIHLYRHYMDRLTRVVASATPQALATAQMTAQVAACREAAREVARLAGMVVAGAGTVLTAVALCASVWRFSPVAGLLVAVALVPVLVAYARVARAEDAYFLPYGEQSRRASYLTEQLVGQRSGAELATLGSAHKVARAADHHLRAASGLMDALVVALARNSAVGAVVTVGLLAGALVAIVAGGDSGGGLAGGVLGVIAGLAATRTGGFAFGELIRLTPKIGAFRALLEDQPDVARQQIVRYVDSVELVDVRVSYPGAQRPALDGITLQACRGTIVAFVGVNGAGKTTAVNALLGIVDVDSGTVRIDGVDAGTMLPAQRLSRFGLLTQEFGRYELTVRDTVTLGTPDEVGDDQVWAALRSANAAELVRDLPQGLDTQLGSQFGGVGLSGGQWQRLALARVYLRDAGVWLLDEPTSTIDAETEQQVFADLQRHKADRITVVVSHRAWTLKGMDHIYVFDHGRVVQHGTYEELVIAGGRFGEIFAEQS